MPNKRTITKCKTRAESEAVQSDTLTKAANPADDPTNNSGSVAIRKRGRPAGSKNKTIRKDHDIQAAEPGKNRKSIQFSLAFSALPSIDVNNPEQVVTRINQFFDICSEFDMKPSVAALAMAFQIDRVTLFNWLNGKTGRIQNKESFNAIKNAYNQICLLYETYLSDGSIIPVSAFFLMKNNYGYKDTTDYVVTAETNNTPVLSDIVSRADLLTE